MVESQGETGKLSVAEPSRKYGINQATFYLGRNRYEGMAVGAVLVPPASGAAVAGLEPLLAREASEVALVGIGDDDHVAAASPVTAVGAALRHVLLAAEAQLTVAATPSLDANPRPVVEHPLRRRRLRRRHQDVRVPRTSV